MWYWRILIITICATASSLRRKEQGKKRRKEQGKRGERIKKRKEKKTAQ